MIQSQVSLVAGALSVLLAASAPRAIGAQEASGPRTVDEFTEAFVGAVRLWDVDAWSGLVAEDVVMMAPSGRRIEGRSAFHDLWTRTFAGRSGRNPLQVVVNEVLSQGDLAVVRAEYGPELEDPVGQYVWVLERDERGIWVLAWWIFNRRPPADG